MEKSKKLKLNAKRIRDNDIMVYARDFILLERKGDITAKAQALTYLAIASLDPFEEWYEGKKIVTKISRSDLRHYKVLTGDHDKRDIDTIKELLEGYSLWVKDTDTEEVGWASPFPYVGIDPEDPDNIIVDINDRVTKYFVGLSHWMDVVTLENVTLNIKRINSRRLYLLLRQKLHRTSDVYIWDPTIQELKAELGISQKYPEYKQFKSKVLIPAIEEIGGNWNDSQAYTSNVDFDVSVKEVKTGRSVTGFIFSLSQKLDSQNGIMIQPDLF